MKKVIGFLVLIALIQNRGDAMKSVGFFALETLEGLATRRTVTPTTYLRKLEDGDARALFELTDKNRQDLRRWLPWLDYCTEEMHSRDFILDQRRGMAEKRSFTMGIFNNDNVVGTVGFNTIDSDTLTGHVGYWLDRGARGKGIVTLSCQKLIEIGFKEIGLQTISLSCGVNNKSSQSVAERIGAKFSHTVHDKEDLYGELVDHHIYILNTLSE